MNNHKTRDWLFVVVFAGVSGSLGAAHRDKEIERAGGRPPPCAAHGSLTVSSGVVRSFTEQDICLANSANSSRVKRMLESLAEPETGTGAPMGESEFRQLLRRNESRPPSPADLQDIVHHELNLSFVRKERTVLEGLVTKGGVEEGVALLNANMEVFKQAEARFGVAPKDVAAVIVAQQNRPPTGGVTGVPTFNALLARLLFMDLEINDAVSSGALTRKHPLASARADAARASAAGALPALLRYAKKTGLEPLEITGRLPGSIGPWGMDPRYLHMLEDGNEDGKAEPTVLADFIATTASIMAAASPTHDRIVALAPFNLSGYSAKLVVALADRIGWKMNTGGRARVPTAGFVPAAAPARPATSPQLPTKHAEDEGSESER